MSALVGPVALISQATSPVVRNPWLGVFTTAGLAVSGNASVGGNLNVTGSINGTINVGSITGILSKSNGGTGTATPAPGSGLSGTFPAYQTIYNGLDATYYCTTPLSPDESCINNAFGAGISNTVISSAGLAINSTIDVPANQNLTLRAGAYTLGNNGKLILEAGASLTCPDGPDSTYFLVPATYAVTDQVWSLAGGNSANQTITGCGIQFFVPSGSTTRAGMVHYAAAALGSVAGTQATGVLVQHVKITGAWDCFRMNTGAGNGKVTIRDANVSSFNTMADIDNIFDTITFDNVHWWPWGLTGPQFPAFFDPANVGIHSGRCDDLQVSNSLFDGGQAMSFYTGTGGVTTFTLTSVKFDTNAGITMSAGQGTMNGGYFSIGNTAARAFNMSGGIFASSGVQWGIVSTTTNSQIQISGPSQFYASSSYFNTGPNDVSMFGISGSTAFVSIIGDQFLRSANVAFVNPTILNANASRVMISNNILTDKGTGLGYFLTMPNDSQSVVSDNSLLGWSMALPASFSSINYHDNSNVGPSSTGQQHLSVFPVSCPGGQHVESINTNGVAACS